MQTGNRRFAPTVGMGDLLFRFSFINWFNPLQTEQNKYNALILLNLSVLHLFLS